MAQFKDHNGRWCEANPIVKQPSPPITVGHLEVVIRSDGTWAVVDWALAIGHNTISVHNDSAMAIADAERLTDVTFTDTKCLVCLGLRKSKGDHACRKF